MDLPPAFVAVAVIFTGLCVGSFLNVVIHRLPLHESVVSPGSRCPNCGRVLPWYENIPVFSYLALKGRCKGCGTPISPRYPIVEALTAGVFYWHYAIFGLTALGGVRVAFAAGLIALFAIDLDHQILPDRITLPGIVAGFVSSLWLPPGPLMSLAGMVAGGGLLWGIAEVWFRLRKVEAMGFGDVKMLAMIGAFLGVRLVLLTFVLSSMVGGTLGALLLVTRQADRATKLPFGTMLAVAALIASLYGETILTWYLANL